MFLKIFSGLLFFVDFGFLLISEVIDINPLQLAHSLISLLLSEGGIHIISALAFYKKPHVLLYVRHLENVNHRRPFGLIFVQ